MRIFFAALLLLGACSSGTSSSGRNCGEVDREIHDAAVKRGLDPATVCVSTDAAVKKAFDNACAQQRSCGG